MSQERREDGKMLCTRSREVCSKFEISDLNEVRKTPGSCAGKDVLEIWWSRGRGEEEGRGSG